jgi:hypothetical protein
VTSQSEIDAILQRAERAEADRDLLVAALKVLGAIPESCLNGYQTEAKRSKCHCYRCRVRFVRSELGQVAQPFPDGPDAPAWTRPYASSFEENHDG